MRAPDFWQRDGAAARLLDPIGRLYGLAGHVRRRLATPSELDIPVICIGNLTAGGAGKTPTAIAIARYLIAKGERPHLLSRGYGGRARGPLRVDLDRDDAIDVGDEPLLLAEVAPTWVSADRVAGGRAAKAAGASHIVMDDGLQNPGLAKDLSLLVVDGITGFGNHRLMPAGPLREALAPAFSRIDAAIVIGPDQAGIEAVLPEGLTRLSADIQADPGQEDLKGRPVLAFAGIGRPAKFFQSLEELGAQIVETHSFPDHHRYRVSEVENLLARAKRSDAACITTAKDHVRLAPNLKNAVEKLLVSLHFDELQHLDKLLSQSLPGLAEEIN